MRTLAAPSNPIRIRLRYADLETFVERFAPNVTRGGVFLASRHGQPVGTVISFEIQLANAEVVLAGQGRVTWVKDFDPAEPNRAFGMGVQFISLEDAAKPILARIIRFKESSGYRRPSTGPMVPLGAGVTGAYPTLGHVPAIVGSSNGRPASPPPVDTSVDLVAAYGLDAEAVRRIMERTWLTGPWVGVDLEELLSPEPAETASLAQALFDLPRLLDPQYSLRRSASGFRAMQVVQKDVPGTQKEGQSVPEDQATLPDVQATEPGAQATPELQTQRGETLTPPVFAPEPRQPWLPVPPEESATPAPNTPPLQGLTGAFFTQAGGEPNPDLQGQVEGARSGTAERPPALAGQGTETGTETDGKVEPGELDETTDMTGDGRLADSSLTDALQAVQAHLTAKGSSEN